MKLLRKYKEFRKNMTRNNAIKSTIRWAIGVDDQLNSLFYIVNTFFSPSLAPKATGDERLLQLCDLELLKIISLFFEKNNFDYWLDYGTLLGAFRHKGFIPWDDDIDIAVMKSDSNKIYSLAKTELEPLGLEVKQLNGWFGIGYKTDKTGIWIDVFNVENTYVKSDAEIDLLKMNLDKFHKRYTKKKDKTNKNRNKIIFKNININGNSRIIFHSPEFPPVYNKWIIHNYDDVFPLKKIIFEDFEVNCPNNIDKYLISIYGNTYMNFPKTGMFHHGNEKKLYEYAKYNSIDMNDVRLYLEKIKNEYEEK